jgi:class 3 adenylate cyclase
LAGYAGATIKSHFRRALAAASARDEVTNLFGQHVSPQVVERLLAIGAAELSEMRRVCVMFVDIRSFTAAARMPTPPEVVARLDAVFEILVDTVDRHSGIVNEFLGDGLLAIFGAPIDDPLEAANAVAAAREMLSVIERGNVGDPWPIRLGIGIHIGQAVAGTVGSPRRKEYTVIGDTVNLASRLESLNKEVGSQLIVSDAVREPQATPSAKLCRSDPSRCAGTPSRSRRGASLNEKRTSMTALPRKRMRKNLRCGQRATVGRTAGTGGFRPFGDLRRYCSLMGSRAGGSSLSTPS